MGPLSGDESRSNGGTGNSVQSHGTAIIPANAKSRPHPWCSVRQNTRFTRPDWLWSRSEGLSLPLQPSPSGQPGPVRWIPATYTSIYNILTNPAYAGAYAYGKTRCERYVDEHGAVRKRMRHLPIEQWPVLLPDHHPGFIDWATFQANQTRLDSNTRPQPH